MTITEDIVSWARTRPNWQQTLLHHLASGSQPDDVLLEDVLPAILDPSPVKAAEPLDLALPPANDERVSLLALTDCRGVNALADDLVLDFGLTGLTVIHGDNGSGKSGYARLVKDIVGARHPATVLPDVFEEVPQEPSATLRYAVDGEEHQQKYPGPAGASLRKISFYDEHCGDVYLAKRSTITYRPSALALLDGLIVACDRLRELLSARAAENQARRLRLNLPVETKAGAFLASLNASTPDEAVAQAVQLPGDVAEQHARAATEVARLQTTDALQERTRLARLAEAFAALAEHLERLAGRLGPPAVEAAAVEVAKVRVAREAAAVAAADSLEAELDGVGGETWRALWAAAREYSLTDAYPGHDFPATHEDARCVLCQQRLSEDAAGRLTRFERFMQDTTQRDAVQAEAVAEARRRELDLLEIESPVVTEHLNLVDTDSPDLAVAVRGVLQEALVVRDATGAWLSGSHPQPTGLIQGEAYEDLRRRAQALHARSTAVDVASFQEARIRAQAVLGELEAHMALARSADAIQEEVIRLRALAKLQRAIEEVGTTQITAKSSQLTRLYASDVIKDRFTRETEQLHLRNVTMRDLGGRKGQLEQQPALLGAKASAVSTMDVLSEGEQTALGLAGFFTEAEFDPSKSGLVLDDPVTSLDHVRREHVARRLAELARDRQVVVFTHDVVFAGELLKNADRLGVQLTPRAVVRQGNVPGHVQASLPWKAKDFKARFADLELRLQKMEKERESFGQEEWEEAVASWAGRLSELWERAVSSEILDEVYDRGTSEVRVMKFRIVAAVTSQDNDDFQAGYGACSKWARRHDKAPETNYVAPEPKQLKAELDRIRDWQARVKKYR